MWSSAIRIQHDWVSSAGSLRSVLHLPPSHCDRSSHLQSIENSPHALHIYDFPSPQESFLPRLRTVLLHQQPILHARWNPVRKGSLSLCCGTQSVYTWSDEWIGDAGQEEEMAECIGVPASEHRLQTSRCFWSDRVLSL